MKKSASLLLVLLLALFSFTACGGEESSSVVSSIASAPPSSSVLESGLPSSSLPESFVGEGVSVEDSEWQGEEWACYYELEYPNGTSYKACYLRFWNENEIEFGFSVLESEPDFAYDGTYYWDEDKLVIDAVEAFRGVFEEEIEDPATRHTVLQVEDNGDLTYTVTLVEGDPLHPYHEYGVPETYYHRKLMYDPKNPPVEIVADWTTYLLRDSMNEKYWFFFIRLWSNGFVETAYGPFESEADWAFAGEYSWQDETTLQLTLEGDYGVYGGEERQCTLQVVGKDEHTVGITLLEGDALVEMQQIGAEQIYYDDLEGFYNPVYDTWTPRG